MRNRIFTLVITMAIIFGAIPGVGAQDYLAHMGLPGYSLNFQAQESQAPPIALSGARNEQLMVVFTVSGVALENLQIELQEKKGISLQVRQIRPVPDNAPAGLLADGLVPLEKGLIFAKAPQHLLITIKVPDSHPAGITKYHLVCRAQGKQIVQPLELKVWRFSLADDLPITIKATFRPNKNWFSRYGVQTPEAFENICESYLSSMRDYKVNAISGYLPAPPKKGVAVGQSLSDFPLFTRRLDLAVNKLGYRAFSIPSPSSGGSNKLADMALQQQLIDNFYPELVKYLGAKGWLGKAQVKLWDEPKKQWFPQAVQLYSQFRKAVPQIRLEGSGWIPNPELVNLVDIWMISARVYDADRMEPVRRAGKEIWVYVNKLHGVDRLPAHQRLIGWYLYRYDFSGYYFWSINDWSKDPWTTPSGKEDFFRRGAFFYPHPTTGRPLPNLRFEALRRGFQDYQYFRLLKEAAAQGKIKPEAYQDIQQTVVASTNDLNNINPSADWRQMEKMRLKIGDLLDSIGK